MKILIRKNDNSNSRAVDFIPENSDETRKIDELFGMNGKLIVPVLGSDGELAGEISGHENQRWIRIY
jgi:hypothetical protein